MGLTPQVSVGEQFSVNEELYGPRTSRPDPVDAISTLSRAPAAGSLEDSDPKLSMALILAEASPTPENHRRVAALYRGHGVLDMAHDHLELAVHLAPHDPATHDGLARLWRTLGLEEFGLGAAYRAVSYAPESPEALMNRTGFLGDRIC